MRLLLLPNWGEVHLLVAGKDTTSVVEAARQVQGISKVLVSDASHYAEGLGRRIGTTSRN